MKRSAGTPEIDDAAQGVPPLTHDPTEGDNDMEADAGAVRPPDKGKLDAANWTAGNGVTSDAAAMPCAPTTYATDTSPTTSAATLSGTATFAILTGHAPQGRPKGRLLPYGKAAYLHRPAARKLQNRMLQGEKECLYDALHHRLNGVVRDFVIETRAVAVGCAAEMLHLDRGIRRLQSAD